MQSYADGRARIEVCEEMCLKGLRDRSLEFLDTFVTFRATSAVELCKGRYSNFGLYQGVGVVALAAATADMISATSFDI